jgi:hypothetical protein
MTRNTPDVRDLLHAADADTRTRVDRLDEIFSVQDVPGADPVYLNGGRGRIINKYTYLDTYW